MSQQPINHSLDLKRLRDEGYDIEIKAGYLLVNGVPYVTSSREIAYGTLVCALTLAGDVTTKTTTHVASFAGEHPFYKDGSRLEKIAHSTQQQDLGQGLLVAGLVTAPLRKLGYVTRLAVTQCKPISTKSGYSSV